MFVVIMVLGNCGSETPPRGSQAPRREVHSRTEVTCIRWLDTLKKCVLRNLFPSSNAHIPMLHVLPIAIYMYTQYACLSCSACLSFAAYTSILVMGI